MTTSRQPGDCPMQRRADDNGAGLSSLTHEVSGGTLELHRRANLALAIETAVIPKLVLSHRNSILASTDLPASLVTPEDVLELARTVTDQNTAAASHLISKLLSRRVSVEGIMTAVIGPAARLLGEMWKTDYCDFADVTIGTSRLQQLVHDLSPDFEIETPHRVSGKRVLLLPVPGEQHTLGLSLVEQYFRKSGWDCWSRTAKNEEELAQAVRSQHSDVVGLSLGCEVLLHKVDSAIKAVRTASRNPSVSVLVGGSVFADKPELARRVGADGTAADGRHALLILHNTLVPASSSS